jgi:outer membrane protein OmpA-like peptidoglycan-associated protein
MGKLGRAALWMTTSLLMMGCGSAAVPPELQSARSAYEEASQGPAAELAPAQLDTAGQALEEANDALARDDEPEVVADLTYIAQRRIALAKSAAAKEAANRKAQKATKEYTDLQEQRYQSAEQDLEATRDKLAEEKRKAEEQARRDKERLEAAAKLGAAEVAKVKAQLAAEKKAREEAEKRAAAAMASLAEIAKVKEEKRGVVVTLSGSVLFATGKHELLPIARNKLADVAKALKDQGFERIVVEGHTDSRGAPAQNEALSLRRAEEVRKALISEGIPADKIKAVGHGSRRPVADNNTAEGRANNRRVELVVTPAS